ncbi:MAG: hypothetical protein H0U95_06010 [Bacteroidetes bacterium]|nr:hypothetical protein [Bacteroidota bacterium]
MKNKISHILCLSFFLFTGFHSPGQIDLEDSRVLKIGYRMGFTRFNPAYVAYPQNSSASAKEYKDYIIPSNLDVWFGKNSEHVFYDANLGGLVYAFAIYAYDLATNKEPNWVNEKMRKSQKNFPNYTKDPPRGSDFDVLDMKLGFGGKGIFFGGQVGYTYFGPGNSNLTYDSDSSRIYNAASSYLSYGLGIHYNANVKTFVMQNSLTFDKLKNKKEFLDGIGLKLESVIYLGKDNGFYFAPYVKWRTMQSTISVSTYLPGSSGVSYVNKDVVVKSSILAFGIRAGFYLSD